jgi:hypothetical protein
LVGGQYFLQCIKAELVQVLRFRDLKLETEGAVLLVIRATVEMVLLKVVVAQPAQRVAAGAEAEAEDQIMLLEGAEAEALAFLAKPLQAQGAP